MARRGPIPAGAGETRCCSPTPRAAGPIPAGAGETRKKCASHSVARAYPRRRGGNMRVAQSRAHRKGLSPQARGKPTCPNNCVGVDGAYPRRRGGNTRPDNHRPYLQGLSPQARGKLIAVSALRISSGPIPAGAGETCGLRRAGRTGRAYPRRRGGNRLPEQLRGSGWGLSPQARGKHQAR